MSKCKCGNQGRLLYWRATVDGKRTWFSTNIEYCCQCHKIIN